MAAGIWAAPLLRLASASTSLSLCHAAFVSNLDPDRVYLEEQRPQAGMGIIHWALRYHVDSAAREVRTTIGGAFTQRALFREPHGCLLAHLQPDPTRLPIPAPAPAPASPPAAAPDVRLRAALDEAFAEKDPAATLQTKAVVVLHDGQLIAERYAAGYGPSTQLWGYSATKSVMSALVGVLVAQGRLRVEARAPVSAWQAPGDPRSAVTLDQLLRMTSGLAFDAGTGLLSPTRRLLYLEADPVGFAESQPLVATPGSQWGYSNVGYAIVSRIVRDAIGGSAQDVAAFVRRELFEPLGMTSARLGLDASGTPVGSAFMFASARDWARFGQMYLDEGVAGGRRVLPEDWVRYSTTPIEGTGYGAGFWTNRAQRGKIPIWGVPWGLGGLPEDAFFCRGSQGQFIIMVPRAKLVVARFGITRGSEQGITDFVRTILDVIQADSHASKASASKNVSGETHE